jgi:hypothetical protein
MEESEMDYYPHLDLLLMALAGLVLCLMASVGTRWDRKRKGEPPRYMGYVKPDVYRSIHGYDPTMRDWAPKMGTVVPRGGFGNE